MRQRAAELEVVQVAAPPRPVPVEARRRRVAGDRQGAFVGGDEGEAGRQHQALLRRADRDVDAERVHRERRRGERGDDVDDEQGRMAGGVDRPAQRRQVRGGAAGGVGVDDEHRGDAVRGVVAQRRLDRRRIDRHALRHTACAAPGRRTRSPARPSRRRSGRCPEPGSRCRRRPGWRSPPPSRRGRWRRRRRPRRARSAAAPSSPIRRRRPGPGRADRRGRSAAASSRRAPRRAPASVRASAAGAGRECGCGVSCGAMVAAAPRRARGVTPPVGPRARRRRPVRSRAPAAAASCRRAAGRSAACPSAARRR